MKNGKRSGLSAFVAAVLVFAMLLAAGCGSKENSVNTETTTESASDETLPAQVEITAESSSADESQSLAGDMTEAVTETTVQPTSPQTVAEIVELFNKSANRIKPEATKVTKNYEKRIVDDEQLVVPESLESTAKSLMDTFMKDDTEPIVYSTREEINSEFLVPGQSYVSRLTADAVAGATCTDKGETYEICIKLKNEKNPTAGKGVGAVCDVIEAAEVAEKASFVEEFSTEYYNCEVKVTIDKATGRVVHAIYKTPLLLKVRVNLFGTHNGAVGLTFIKNYTITY